MRRVKYVLSSTSNLQSPSRWSVAAIFVQIHQHLRTNPQRICPNSSFQMTCASRSPSPNRLPPCPPEAEGSSSQAANLPATYSFDLLLFRRFLNLLSILFPGFVSANVGLFMSFLAVSINNQLSHGNLYRVAHLLRERDMLTPNLKLRSAVNSSYDPCQRRNFEFDVNIFLSRSRWATL